MPFLKRENANQHCRTCLINLKPKIKNTLDEGFISIPNNRDLEAIIKKCIDLRATDYIKDYPQNLCVPCYNKLLTFDRFCKRAQLNAEKLHKLLNGSDQEIKEEIEYGSDDSQSSIQFGLTTHNDAKLKDSLLETESVFFNKPSTEEIIENLDPFINTPLTDPSDNDDDDDDENESTSMQKNSSDTSSCEKDANVKNDKNQKEVTSGKSRKRIIHNLKCNQCKQRFAYKSTLETHVRLVHEGNTQPYQCDHCNKSYSFIGDLYTHMKEQHEDKKNAFCCDVEGCDRSYASANGLNHHKRIKHTDESCPDDKKFVCEQCGMLFYQSYNLKIHYRSKHPTPEELVICEQKKKSYECKLCKRFFYSQYTLNYHNMRTHTNDMNKFECDICGKRLAKKFMLAAHKLMHSGPRYPCEYCGREFTYKIKMQEHVKAVHLKLRPFHCRYCPESFACRKTVKHHEYIHTGEKPYVCEVCGQAYRQQSCLKNHRKTHENQTMNLTVTAKQ